MSEYDKFLRLTHIDAKEGVITRTPLFLEPEDVKQICDGVVYLAGGGSFTVTEKAEAIHQAVIKKLAENKQAQTMGQQ